MNSKVLFIVPFIFSSIFFANVFAEEQVPGMVMIVEGDPFYFSEGGLGPSILKYFERPLDPYLVPGLTNEQSSFEEIKDAYNENTKDKTQKNNCPR